MNSSTSSISSVFSSLVCSFNGARLVDAFFLAATLGFGPPLSRRDAGFVFLPLAAVALGRPGAFFAGSAFSWLESGVGIISTSLGSSMSESIIPEREAMAFAFGIFPVFYRQGVCFNCFLEVVRKPNCDNVNMRRSRYAIRVSHIWLAFCILRLTPQYVAAHDESRKHPGPNYPRRLSRQQTFSIFFYFTTFMAGTMSSKNAPRLGFLQDIILIAGLVCSPHVPNDSSSWGASLHMPYFLRVVTDITLEYIGLLPRSLCNVQNGT